MSLESRLSLTKVLSELRGGARRLAYVLSVLPSLNSFRSIEHPIDSRIGQHLFGTLELPSPNSQSLSMSSKMTKPVIAPGMLTAGVS